MVQFLKELFENRHVVIPVLAGVAVWILTFILSLKLRKQIDTYIKIREDKFVKTSNSVKAVRVESNSNISAQGHPLYRNSKYYNAHYEYEVDGKKYKYHSISFVFPTNVITLAYRDNPKKAVWIHDIPKPLWYKIAKPLLWLAPFAAALLTVFLLGGAK